MVRSCVGGDNSGRMSGAHIPPDFTFYKVSLERTCDLRSLAEVYRSIVQVKKCYEGSGSLRSRTLGGLTRSSGGARPRDAAGDTHKQAGRQSTALTGASLRSCHVTKRFRILATLKQGNKSMYSNTSGYVHMGLRLDCGKGITEQ